MEELIDNLLRIACAVVVLSFVGWLHVEFWILIFEHVRWVW